MTIRILLVDDQELVRTGFRMVLDAQPDMTVVGEAGDGLSAVALLSGTQADVAVMDVRMPKLDGIEATRRICAAGERPRVLMLTTFDLDEYAFAALKAGASGFLLKDVPPEELLFGIRAVHSGDAVVAPSTTKRLIDRFAPMLPAGAEHEPPDLAGLTSREREVLTLIARARQARPSRPRPGRRVRLRDGSRHGPPPRLLAPPQLPAATPQTRRA
jgi:DNA-binding NarL/FixJ family response regulator